MSVFAVLISSLRSTPAFGQGAAQVVPSLSVTQTYDSNLLFSAADPQTDFITRVTPGIELRRESPLMTFTSRYRLDADRFADHPALTAIDGHHALVGFRYTPTRRLVFAADAEITRTQIPSELNTDTGLASTRAAATRFAVHPSAVRHLDPVTDAIAEYSFTEDHLAGGVRLRAQMAAVGAERRVSAREKVRLGYAVQLFDFGLPSAVTSQTLTVGWTRQLARPISLTLRGGPRLLENRVTADLAASLEARARSASMSLSYAQTRTTLIGLAGTAASESVIAEIAWEPWRRTQVRVAPAASRIVREGLQSRVYRLGFSMSHPVANGLSLRAAYDANVQHGNIYPTVGLGAISRHVVSIGFVGGVGSAPR